MYTTENYLNAEIEYRANKVKQSWSRRRREENRDQTPGRFLSGQRTRTDR